MEDPTYFSVLPGNGWQARIYYRTSRGDQEHSFRVEIVMWGVRPDGRIDPLVRNDDDSRIIPVSEFARSQQSNKPTGRRHNWTIVSPKEAVEDDEADDEQVFVPGPQKPPADAD